MRRTGSSPSCANLNPETLNPQPRNPQPLNCEDPRPHAWSMCASCFVLYYPVTCNPCRAVTLPNIGVPRRVTNPYEPHARFFLIKGSVEVVLDETHGVFAELREGSYFGENCVLGLSDQRPVSVLTLLFPD